MTTDQQARQTTVTEPSDLEICVERVFDAPRDLVYAVFHDPKLIPEWWGETTTVDVMDVEPAASGASSSATREETRQPSAGSSAS